MAGCSETTSVRISDPDSIATPPNFCDLTDDRLFTEAVARWRAENDRANLEKDVTENQLRAELCRAPS